MTFEEIRNQPNFIDLVEEKLRELAAEKPDFRYREGRKLDAEDKLAGCSYFQGPMGNRGSCNGCIFGQAFRALGATEEELRELVGTIRSVMHHWRITCPDSWTLLQEDQDLGSTWGEAIKRLDGVK